MVFASWPITTFDKVAGMILFVFLVLEVAFGGLTLRRIIQNQTARFMLDPPDEHHFQVSGDVHPVEGGRGVVELTAPRAGGPVSAGGPAGGGHSSSNLNLNLAKSASGASLFSSASQSSLGGEPDRLFQARRAQGPTDESKNA